MGEFNRGIKQYLKEYLEQQQPKKKGQYDFAIPLLEEDGLDPLDCGYRALTGVEYTKFRLLPTWDQYKNTVEKLQWFQIIFECLKLFCAGCTTVCSGAQQFRWVPLIAGVTFFLEAISSFEQLETQIRNLNDEILALKKIWIWWQSLTLMEQGLPDSKNRLVQETEKVMNAEISAWANQSRQAANSKPDGEKSQNNSEQIQGYKKKDK